MGREQYYSTTSINILNTLNGCERALLASLVCRDLKVTDSTLVFLTHLLSLSFQWLHLIPNISKGTKGPWKNIKWGKKKSILFSLFLSRKVTKKGKLGLLKKLWSCCIPSDFWSFPELYHELSHKRERKNSLPHYPVLIILVWLISYSTWLHYKNWLRKQISESLHLVLAKAIWSLEVIRQGNNARNNVETAED